MTAPMPACRCGDCVHIRRTRSGEEDLCEASGSATDRSWRLPCGCPCFERQRWRRWHYGNTDTRDNHM